jgi:HD-GYP domain-containing protein (c-di-GMP phosphodiesterase class II)
MASSEDRESPRYSQDLINQLSVILRTAKLHDPGNVAVVSAIEKFLVTINESLGTTDDGLVLELIGEFFYINGFRVRYSLEYLLNFDFLIREFKKREIGKVIFRRGLRAGDMQTFLKTFISAGFSESPYESMSEGMSPVENIDIDILKKVKEGDGDTRQVVKKSYFKAVSFTKGVMTKIKSGEKVVMKKAKRVVESMVDHLLAQENLLMGMTAIKDYDEYTYHHSVNVSILSIALGQRLGLNKRALTELGLVALFHDIGKIEIPPEVLNKKTDFSEEDWNTVRRHPVWGLKALLKLKGMDSTSIRSSIVAFEHHLHFNLSGYPKVAHYSELDLYSKIVCLVDQYDAMTSARVYSRSPMSPDKALSVMMERSGTQIDPLLLKFFINMVGVYPIGTLVMLNTRELGLVYEADVVFNDRPKVLVIIDRNGNRIEGTVVSLTEKDANGRYYRSIARTMDPDKYKINLALYLL